ncbi:hypothetical protein CDCA_CDCA17G4367 [Cyanidium caldarium]|uniref:V-type proton ATPase subunit a n=1 Tax=Cyanidium caldarium TaxID=2771 RepID=A0AAV9J192_CYACA|nr:hypothetical protein CDCA_CDCA17G4367 [Cyanidium caldarium]
MVLLRIYFQRVAAHECIDELGQRELVEFRDLNVGASAFQRTFSGDIKRCDELQRRLRFLAEQVEQVLPGREAEGRTVLQSGGAGASRGYTGLDGGKESWQAQSLEELERHLGSLERDVLDMNVHWDAMRREHSDLVEFGYVLELGATLFADAASPRTASALYGTLDLIEGARGEASVEDVEARPEAVAAESTGGRQTLLYGSVLSLFAGTVDTEHAEAFARLLFRASRGNCFTRFMNIPDKVHDVDANEDKLKSVFVLLFPGTELRAKVGRICEAFGGKRYAFPDEEGERRRLLADVRAKLAELQAVIESTHAQRVDVLGDIAANLESWSARIYRDKAIYYTLDQLNYDMSQRLFVGECWCPRDMVEEVRAAVHIGDLKSNAQAPSVVEERRTGDAPPTLFRTNKFTAVWQNIVEAYGIPEYKEMNPAPWSIASFPFLFAVMFGDVGHGTLMTLCAVYIVLRERHFARQRLGDLMQTLYDGRYILLLMGVFSIFTGLVYNECFAVPLDLFGTRWRWNSASDMACGIDNCADPAKVLPPRNPYPFGFDPFWKAAQNGLTMYNSYKMKLSIGFAVSQMTLGIVLSLTNALYFQRSVDVWHVFVPQILFFTAVFGYLFGLILLKWSINWSAPGAGPAPDLKSVLIGMFMSPGRLPPDQRLFRGQGVLQVALLAVAVATVPWMLLVKPLVLRRRARSTASASKRYQPLSSEAESVPGLATDGGSQAMPDEPARAPFDLVEAFVNNMIHTVEFVLGAISNTASYLRLWALSLAHAELSEVFLQKVLFTAVNTSNVLLAYIGFLVWVGLTIGVLMLMESLSAFLHALRLHWVEFQNKFYNLHGSGAKFEPLRFHE